MSYYALIVAESHNAAFVKCLGHERMKEEEESLQV